MANFDGTWPFLNPNRFLLNLNKIKTARRNELVFCKVDLFWL